MRAPMETAFQQIPGGMGLMRTLMAGVKTALAHGLHLIFLASALMMLGAVVLNLMLKNVPLRGQHQAGAPGQEPAAH